MNRYTLHCTPEQTKKALELGAHLEIGEGKGTVFCKYQNYNTYKRVIVPTAEQMIGWLRSKGFRFKITDFEEGTIWKVTHGDWFDFNGDEGVSPNEATLAAIDAALEYLTNNKK